LSVVRTALVLVALAGSCHSVPRIPATVAPSARAGGLDFLQSAIRPWPSPAALTRLVVVTPSDTRVSIYDNALVALLLDRLGRHDEAGRILESLAALQRPDGGIPFSFSIERADEAPPYVRSGALAWVGYAAVEYLDGSPGGPARDTIVRMAHRIASYLTAHQVDTPGDPRDGLVTGGEGEFAYDLQTGRAEETFVPGAIAWASMEHNIDAFFFLRDLGRVTEQAAYTERAQRVRDALLTRAWDGQAGQLRRGLLAKGDDRTLALDCASWGSLFLLAAGDRTRAETAWVTADTRFASRDPRTGIVGHRPYAIGPVFEDPSMAAYYARTGTPADWATLQAVWPEGSAGIALAAVRLGHPRRASAILEELERFRDSSGGLPMMTAEVPFEFDTKPSVAGTAWVELVRPEIEEGAAPFLWRP
jgi:hypothetical protein